MMQQLFEFEENKTFFGLYVYRHGVKITDIEKLPFYRFFYGFSYGFYNLYIWWYPLCIFAWLGTIL